MLETCLLVGLLVRAALPLKNTTCTCCKHTHLSQRHSAHCLTATQGQDASAVGTAAAYWIWGYPLPNMAR